MITRDEAVQLAKDTHSYRNFSHAFVLELLKAIIELHDQMHGAYMNGARAGMQGDVNPEDLPSQQ